MTPTISIVIPAYNVQRYIEQCVRSVLGQLRAHHELVIVDDGSSDNTLALLTALQAGWPQPNFRLYTQANEGIASTRNRCIDAAQGEYIAFVDSDDVLRDGSLQVLDDAIAAHHPDVMAFDFRMWHPNDPAKTHAVGLDYPVGVLRDRQALLVDFMANRHMYLWAHVIRRAIYTALPAPIFPPGRVFEDVATMPRLISECTSLLHVPHQIVDYRQHLTGITQSISERWCLEFVAALPVARGHLLERAVGAPVRAQFDLMIAHFYMSLVKSSYQLPYAIGQRTRTRIKTAFLDNLFGNYASLRATGGAQDRRMLAELGKVMSGNLAFHLKQAASRQYKMWRQARKVRAQLAAAPLAEQR